MFTSENELFSLPPSLWLLTMDNFRTRLTLTRNDFFTNISLTWEIESFFQQVSGSNLLSLNVFILLKFLLDHINILNCFLKYRIFQISSENNIEFLLSDLEYLIQSGGGFDTSLHSTFSLICDVVILKV